MPGLLGSYRRGGSVPPVITTWNPSDKSSAIVLSGSNLIATISGQVGDFESVRATVSHTSGKFYFEVFVNASTNNFLVGVSTSALSLATYVGANLMSVGYYTYNGAVLINAITQLAVAPYDDGDTVCVAFDADNSRIWFRKGAAGFWNGSGTANPATNTGGVAFTPGAYFPAWTGEGHIANGTDQCTANFGASTFTGTVPSGFVAWNG